PNLPVHVNAASRTEACAAVAQLKALKAAKRPRATLLQAKEGAVPVTDKAWDGSPSRFTDEQYASSCVLDRGPSVTSVKERSAPDTLVVEGRKLRGRIPYEVESRDLGGWTEVIRRGALRSADTGDLVATVDHAGLPIGRYPGTLTLEERDDGVHWSVELPE